MSLESEFERLRGNRYRFLAAKYGKDAADEILGEAARIIWQNPGAYDPARGSLEAFILSKFISCERHHFRGRPHLGVELDRIIETARRPVPDQSGEERPQLNESERRVVLLLSHGLSRREMADKLMINLSTVDGYILQAKRKLKARSTLDMLRILGCLKPFIA